MRKILLLLMVITINSCKEKDIVINNSLRKELNDYIKSNPVKNPLKDTLLLDKETPKQLYQIFFDKDNLDTIMAIKLVSHLNPFSIINFQKAKDSSDVIVEMDYKGYFLIDDTPIVVFDQNNYSKNLINENSLKNPLPNDFIFEIGKINSHVNSKAIFYRLINNKLEKKSNNNLN
jgi:hypothetical protein